MPAVEAHRIGKESDNRGKRNRVSAGYLLHYAVDEMVREEDAAREKVSACASIAHETLNP